MKYRMFGNAATSSCVPITSEEVARRIKTATDPLTKQLEKLCDVMRELRRDTSGRSEDTCGLVQGPSRPRGDMFDSITWKECVARKYLARNVLTYKNLTTSALS